MKNEPHEVVRQLAQQLTQGWSGAAVFWFGGKCIGEVEFSLRRDSMSEPFILILNSNVVAAVFGFTQCECRFRHDDYEFTLRIGGGDFNVVGESRAYLDELVIRPIGYDMHENMTHVFLVSTQEDYGKQTLLDVYKHAHIVTWHDETLPAKTIQPFRGASSFIVHCRSIDILEYRARLECVFWILEHVMPIVDTVAAIDGGEIHFVIYSRVNRTASSISPRITVRESVFNWDTYSAVFNNLASLLPEIHYSSDGCFGFGFGTALDLLVRSRTARDFGEAVLYECLFLEAIKHQHRVSQRCRDEKLSTDALKNVRSDFERDLNKLLKALGMSRQDELITAYKERIRNPIIHSGEIPLDNSLDQYHVPMARLANEIVCRLCGVIPSFANKSIYVGDPIPTLEGHVFAE